MDPDLIITSATALVAAVIGATAAIASQYLQSRRAERTNRESSLQEAIEDVMVKSLAVTSRCHELVVLGAEQGSITGQFGRLLGVMAPINFQALFEPMNAAVDDMNRAASRIWMTADPEMASKVNAVAQATANVVDAHRAMLGRGPWQSVTRTATGRLPGNPEGLKQAQSELARARSELVEQCRTTWRLEPVVLVDGVPPQ